MTAFHRGECDTCGEVTLHYKAACIHCGSRIELSPRRYDGPESLAYNNVKVERNLAKRQRRKEGEADLALHRASLPLKKRVCTTNPVFGTGSGRSYR